MPYSPYNQGAFPNTRGNPNDAGNWAYQAQPGMGFGGGALGGLRRGSGGIHAITQRANARMHTPGAAIQGVASGLRRPTWGSPMTQYQQQTPSQQPQPQAPGPRGPAGPSGPSSPMGGLIEAMPSLPPVKPIDPIDDSEAVREAYARAKDTAGQQGRAALDSLMDLQGARGVVGSGLGINEAGGVIAEGARQLGDFNREQAIQRVENERWRQGTNYQGQINQRGQDQNWLNMELERRRWNAGHSPYGHTQGSGVNPVPMPYPRY